jgi:selenocysteine-specific elongation factor
VIRVTADLYYLSSTIDQVRAILKKYLSDKAEISAASFRDLINSSRKYTIPLLEYFDREGVTLRIGDVRRLKSSGAGGK